MNAEIHPIAAGAGQVSTLRLNIISHGTLESKDLAFTRRF